MNTHNLQTIHLNSTIMEGFYFVATVKKWDEKTYESYHGDFKILERYVKERGIQPVLSQLSEKIIREFFFDMGKEKASATVRRYHGTLSRIFKRLERENIRNTMIDI